MSQELAKLPFSELRDRLAARADQVGYADNIDLTEALRYLTSLPEQEHTEDSGHALIELGKTYFMAGKQEEALLIGTVTARIATSLQDQLLLCRARSMQGVALRDLGRFSDAAVALAETWTLARALNDVERTILAIQNIAAIFLAWRSGKWRRLTTKEHAPLRPSMAELMTSSGHETTTRVVPTI